MLCFQPFVSGKCPKPSDRSGHVSIHLGCQRDFWHQTAPEHFQSVGTHAVGILMKTARGTEERVFRTSAQRNVLVRGFLNLCQQRTEAFITFLQPNPD